VVVDQSWIYLHGGNEELARMAAKSGADDAITLMNEAFAFNTTFDITFVRAC